MPILLFWMILMPNMVLQANPGILQSAQEAMQAKQFDKALRLYTTLDSLGYGNEDMFANMAIASAAAGRTSEAILFVEKARKYAPLSDDINKLVLDLRLGSETSADTFTDTAFISVMTTLTGMFYANTWILISLFLLIVTLLSGWLYYTEKRPPGGIGRVGSRFPLRGSVVAILCLFSMAAAALRHHQIFENTGIIVMQAGCSIRVGPDEQSPELTTPAPGSKLYIIDAIGTWWQIKTPEGDEGWIRASCGRRI